jgi:hypothetical protein
MAGAFWRVRYWAGKVPHDQPYRDVEAGKDPKNNNQVLIWVMYLQPIRRFNHSQLFVNYPHDQTAWVLR